MGFEWMLDFTRVLGLFNADIRSAQAGFQKCRCVITVSAMGLKNNFKLLLKYALKKSSGQKKLNFKFRN